MPAYRYRQGDRPLDGYTIEHGVGRGGFGEVYYAVSDSGRQVALKSLHQFEDIELRGIGHVMNLKSPHLISIFDVKRSERGEPFVIMEYVSGPSLRELLDDHPTGLGADKAAFFVREIAKGLTLLHDAGIVHRDVKPHNIFYEDGYVKIGDYSLSKVITASHRSGHTMTVGSVHYMAPEIGMGKYDKTVDIYSLGILLYEMIKGVPPFCGESMGEVLMKHLSHAVDLSGIDEPYASVLRKSLAKDPKDRFQSAEEMVEALFGADHVRESVSVFNPQSLTVMAARIKIPLAKQEGELPRHAAEPSVNDADYPAEIEQEWIVRSSAPRRKSPRLARSLGRLGGRIGAAFAFSPYSYADRPRQEQDPLSRFHRLMLAALVVFVISSSASAIGSNTIGYQHPGDIALGIGCVVVAWSVMARLLTVPLLSMNSLLHRLAFVGSFLALMLAFDEGVMGEVARFATPVALAVGLLDLRWLMAPIRPKRLRLTPCLFAAFISMIACLATIRDDYVPLTMGFAIGITMALQVLSEFDPVASAKIVRSVSWVGAFGDTVSTWYEWRFPANDFAEKAGRAVGNVVLPIRDTVHRFGKAMLDQVEKRARWKHADRRGETFENQVAVRPDAAPKTSIDVLLDETRDVALEAFRAEDSVHGGSTGKPISNAASHLNSPASWATDSNQEIDPELPNRPVTLLVALLPFVSLGTIPLCGLHRFYTGRRVSGLVWLLTLGLCGVGQLIDIMMIALGEFTDGRGRNLISGKTTGRRHVEPVNGLSSVPVTHRQPGSRMVILSGGMLIVTLFLGMTLAADFPRMLQGDVFREMGLSRNHIERVFGGSKNWQGVLFDVALLFTTMIGISTALLLIVSRARHGFLHMFRALLASGMFLGSFFAFHEALHRVNWEAVAMGIETERIGVILDATLGSYDFIPMTIVTGVIVMAGLIMLSIPPRRPKSRVIERVTTLVEQEA